jgi:hypothetical protein
MKINSHILISSIIIKIPISMSMMLTNEQLQDEVRFEKELGGYKNRTEA